MKLSVVIPVRNEAPNIAPLVAAVLLLALAPMVPVVGVTLAYGPGSDPAEVTLTATLDGEKLTKTFPAGPENVKFDWIVPAAVALAKADKYLAEYAEGRGKQSATVTTRGLDRSTKHSRFGRKAKA